MAVTLVMGVRKVCMGMYHPLVLMRVRMLGSWRNRNIVRMLVVLIMNVFMAMCHGLMGMRVRMLFGQM